MSSTSPIQDNASRLTELERLAADQERVIGELSQQVAEQWETIEAFRKRLEMLVNRLAEVEDMSAPDIPITKPPHW